VRRHDDLREARGTDDQPGERFEQARVQAPFSRWDVGLEGDVPPAERRREREREVERAARGAVDPGAVPSYSDRYGGRGARRGADREGIA
jgi:hypothetical protein